MNFSRIFIVGLCAVAQAAQSNVAGSTKPPPGTDSNPSNPANWLISSPVYSGQDVAVRTELVSGTPTTVTYTRAWGTPLWYRGGASVGVLALPFYQLYGSHDITFDSSGSVRRTVHWQGVGPAPSQVIVKVQSYTSSSWCWGLNCAGSGTVDNGLSGSIINNYLQATCPEPIIETPQWELRILTVNGSDATLAVSPAAHAEGGGSGAGVAASAGSLSVVIDGRSVDLQVSGGIPNFGELTLNAMSNYTWTTHMFQSPTEDADGSAWFTGFLNGNETTPPPHVQYTCTAIDVGRGTTWRRPS